MTKLITRIGMVMAALALVVVPVSVQRAYAASTVYAFIARGIVTDFDNTNGTVNLDITKVANKGKQDLEGNNTQFIVKNANPVYKIVNGKDKRVTYHNLAIGQEVGIKGVKKNDDTYVVNFIRIEDRSFTAVGRLESYNSNTHTMTLLMEKSTYKPKAYDKSKAVKVNMVFGEDYSTFYSAHGNGKAQIAPSDINADAQRVKVVGYITDTNTWKVTKMWVDYKGK